MRTRATTDHGARTIVVECESFDHFVKVWEMVSGFIRDETVAELYPQPSEPEPR